MVLPLEPIFEYLTRFTGIKCFSYPVPAQPSVISDKPEDYKISVLYQIVRELTIFSWECPLDSTIHNNCPKEIYINVCRSLTDGYNDRFRMHRATVYAPKGYR